jgi:hypothetical protein
VLVVRVSYRDEKRGNCSSLSEGEVEAEGVSTCGRWANKHLMTEDGSAAVHGPGISYRWQSYRMYKLDITFETNSHIVLFDTHGTLT